ncbi:MAG: L-threonylcarbamoyladenylate synthase, partial [FCB group bacterium]
MITKFFIVDATYKEALRNSVQLIRNGNIIIFPTETVYGIGADIYNVDSIKYLYLIKKRPINKPLGAYINSISMVENICEFIPESFYILAEKFLPGPLSIILKKNKKISPIVTGGLETIAIRMPDNKFILDVLESFGNPLAGTSANISGNESAINAFQAKDFFEGKVSAIFDGGECKYGKESTLISLAGVHPKLLR